MEGVSLLSFKLSVFKELSHFGGELQSEKSPRLLDSKNLDYFKIAGILKWRGFTIVQNFTLIFGIPKFRSILEPRECQAEGVTLLSLKLSVLKELSHFQGELQSEKIPAVIKFQNS